MESVCHTDSVNKVEEKVMKKHIGYIVGVALLAMGCDSTVLEYPVDGGVDPTRVHVNLTFEVDPTLEPYTKVGMPDRTDEVTVHDVRWIIEIFRDNVDGELVERRVLNCDPDSEGNHTVDAAFDLHAAKYRVVAWMDYVEDGSTEDKYYQIESLASINILDAENYIGDEDHKDTYVGNQELDLTAYRDRWDQSVDRTILLERPMAKIEFITTDVDKLFEEWTTQNARRDGVLKSLPEGYDLTNISSWQVQIEYAGYLPSSFNAYTNKPNDAQMGISFTTTLTPLSSQEAHLGSDYIFVNGEESAVNVNLRVLDEQGTVINEVQGIEVPIARGKLTSIRDEFLTQSYAPGIGIDPEFDGDIEVVIPD